MPQSYTVTQLGLQNWASKRCVLWFLIARGEFECVCENTYMGHGSTDTDPWPMWPIQKMTHLTHWPMTHLPIACSACYLGLGLNFKAKPRPDQTHCHCFTITRINADEFDPDLFALTQWTVFTAEVKPLLESVFCVPALSAPLKQTATHTKLN